MCGQVNEYHEDPTTTLKVLCLCMLLIVMLLQVHKAEASPCRRDLPQGRSALRL